MYRGRHRRPRSQIAKVVIALGMGLVLVFMLLLFTGTTLFLVLRMFHI